MTTIQEYLNQNYPTKWEWCLLTTINTSDIRNQIGKKLEGGELDLTKFTGLESIIITDVSLITPLTKIIAPVHSNITKINIVGNKLTSIDFLNDLSNPEKMEELKIHDNNIEPTNIEIFSRFTNLKLLKIGTQSYRLEQGKHNKFYGSLKSYQNLTKLERICIEATDVNEGLEYLPSNLIQTIKEKKEKVMESGGEFECSPHNLDVGCKSIQNQLRKYDYDIEAWQLAHPHLMYQVKPELFQQEETREKWLEAVNKKIEETQEKLSIEIKEKKAKRLRSKIRELKLIKNLMDEREIFEDSLKAGVRWYDKHKEDKAIQTENFIEVKNIEK